MSKTVSSASEDIEAFRPHLQRFLRVEMAPLAKKWRSQKALDSDIWPTLGKFGMLLPSIPTRYGGLGKSFALDAAIIEDVEKIVPELTHGVMAQNAIVPHYILRYASQALIRDWLPRLARGELVAAIAISEPSAGSDMRALQMRATRRGNRFVLNGQKTFVTNGNAATLLVVAAKLELADGVDGVSLFVVETDKCAGVQRGNNLEKIGLHASGASELFFDNVAVSEDCLLGGLGGQGMQQMREQLPQERVAIAVSAVASMERAIEIAIKYSKERVVFGKPVFDFQANSFTLAEAKTKAFIARIFVDWCVERLTSGKLDEVAACMAKWWSTDTQVSIIDACLQIHGGYGYMDEYEISRMFIDARAQKIYGGTNEIMKHVIARSL
jgi:acyl-CoA dehydrogenase